MRKSLHKVRYGFVGAGAIAQRRHLPEAASDARAVVVAVADPVVERAEEVAGTFGAAAFTDYRKMLKSAEIDAVVVAGPNVGHASASIAALRAGKHVLCEKPMATTLADGRAMVAAARKAGKLLMVAMNQRFMPQHVRAREILASGRLGRVLTFRSVFAHGGPERWSVDGAGSWFVRKKEAAFGVLGDLGVHKIDLLRWLMGQELTEVSADVVTLHKRTPGARGRLIDVDDNARLMLRTSGGAVGSVEVSWTHYGRQDNSTVIACEGGVVNIGTHPRDHLVIDHRNGDREAHRFAGVDEGGWPVRSGVIDAFTDCILNGKKPPVDGGDGLRSLAVVLAGMESARRRRTVKITSK